MNKHTPSKAELRATYRALRQQISPEYRQQAAKDAAALLVKQPCFQQSKHIACYYPHKTEFDSTSIVTAIWQANKKCYLPAIAQENTSLILHFVRYEQDDVLHANRFGILEPSKQGNLIAIDKLDMVLVPLIAFDMFGNRLGSGAGYYDRTFGDKHAYSSKKTLLLGLAYQIQKASILPTEHWDICLDGILTEVGFFYSNKQPHR